MRKVESFRAFFLFKLSELFKEKGSKLKNKRILTNTKNMIKQNSKRKKRRKHHLFELTVSTDVRKIPEKRM